MLASDLPCRTVYIVNVFNLHSSVLSAPTCARLVQVPFGLQLFRREEVWAIYTLGFWSQLCKQYCVFHLEINSRSRSSHRQKESSGVLRRTEELSVAGRRAQTQRRLSLQRAEDQKRQWRKIPSRCSQTSACMYAPDECQAESSFMWGLRELSAESGCRSAGNSFWSPQIVINSIV